MPIKTAKTFSPDLTRRETIAGWVYLPIHILVLPGLIGAAFLLFPGLPFSPAQLNGIYYLVGMVIVVLFFRKLVRREFDRLWDAPLSFLYGVVGGYMMWYLLSLLTQALFTALGWFQDANPNNSVIDALSRDDFRVMKTITVFFAPVLEEVLFRGVVFQSIRKKHRILAYAVSVGLFSVYHVWQYALTAPMMLWYAVQYIPVTLAITWSYERSGTLFAPIALHMFNNYLAFAVMQMAG